MASKELYEGDTSRESAVATTSAPLRKARLRQFYFPDIRAIPAQQKHVSKEYRPRDHLLHKPKRHPRILVLDGAGRAGTSQLLILQSLMAEVAKLMDVSRVHPFEYFDLICGSGLGGVLAIMLGRLKLVFIPHAPKLTS
jgi:hypothetical protein